MTVLCPLAVLLTAVVVEKLIAYGQLCQQSLIAMGQLFVSVDAEPLHAYGMRSDGLWQHCRVADNNPRQSWIETFRAYFQTADTYDVDTFTPMYTFTGAADEIETGAVEAFPIDHFVGDLPDGQGTAISPVIRTVEADGTNRYFDLQGRQIGTKPASGVYIKDGKKFISNNNNYSSVVFVGLGMVTQVYLQCRLAASHNQWVMPLKFRGTLKVGWLRYSE